MTKSQQILSLYDGQRSTSEIAAIVGCRDSYVRVVARQRKGRGYSDSDRRYINSSRGQMLAGAAYERKRHATAAYAKAWHVEMNASGDRDKAREAGRVAYAKAKGTQS